MSPAPPSAALDRTRSYVDSHFARFRDELFELLRIPSVSAYRANAADTARAADWTRARLERAGLKVRRIDTAGHPIVLGERPGAPGAPRLLIYGHYDVQPAEPLEKWRHPPFAPAIEGDNVIARGATDDKGQFLALVCGLEAALACGLGREVGLKVLIEGEEEVGSRNLTPFIRAEKELLACDAVIISDSSQLAAGIPAITYGLRGIATLEVVLRGPAQDLHSGAYGGAVQNPAAALASVLNACRAPFGKVAIPRFYERVRALEGWERQAWAQLPFDEETFRQEAGVPRLWGEEGFTTLERKWARPTFEINGLTSGHQGEGVKTVLPAEARAKLSMRLVPDQEPEEIARLARDFIQSVLPETVRAEFILGHGAKPVVVDTRGPVFQAARRAVAAGFGREPVLIREGGTIPVVIDFKRELGADSVLIGLGLSDDGAHGPNEKFALGDFRKGMLTMAALLDEVQAGSAAR